SPPHRRRVSRPVFGRGGDFRRVLLAGASGIRESARTRAPSSAKIGRGGTTAEGSGTNTGTPAHRPHLRRARHPAASGLRQAGRIPLSHSRVNRPDAPMIKDSLIEQFQQAGQGQVFAFYDTL